MLFREGEWILYSPWTDPRKHGEIVASTNAQLVTGGEGWTPMRPVLVDPEPSFEWGNLESPYVIKRGGYYYLFITRTGTQRADYFRTLVFRSADRFHFEWAPIAQFHAHAAEVVTLDDGRTFLTSAGWASETGEAMRGLSIVELGWIPDAR
jgi:hypothetical protein